MPSDLFERRLQEIMRGYAGVYALYRGKLLYYTGLCSHLFWRLKSHLRDRHRGKWDHFIIFPIKKVQYSGGILVSIGYTARTPATFPPFATVLPRKSLDPHITWRGSWKQLPEAITLLQNRRISGMAVLRVD